MATQNVLLVSAEEWGWTDLRTVIQEMPELTVVSEATSVEEAVWKAQRLQPNVVISAAMLHGLSTRALLRQHQTEICPAATIIRFSPSLDPLETIESEDLRLSGHLLWSELTPARLRSSLTALVEGGIMLRSRGFIDHYLDTLTDPSSDFTITDLDRAILESLKSDLSPDEIAVAHNTSERTVRRRVDHLKERFGVRTLFALGYAASRHGLIE